MRFEQPDPTRTEFDYIYISKEEKFGLSIQQHNKKNKGE